MKDKAILLVDTFVGAALAVLGLLLLAGPAAARSAAPEAPAPPATPAAAADLMKLSLDELMKIEVSTVSRKAERLWSAPSGVDVVTGEDIRRAGAENLPDALRLATGVHVGQPSKRSWAVSIRGMNVLAANKISVVMDGRSLFTPFFSGVQWDAQDTLLEDIDRIEVVRGPVGALWGAFAVNGFIQILTKSAWDTPGLLAGAGTGTEDPGLFAARYGGKIGADTAYRVYAKYFQTDWSYLANGHHAQPATDFFQSGFRIDGRRSADTTLTLQGDLYTNRGLPLDRLMTDISGGNVLGRWRRTLSPTSSVQAQAYFDHTYRLIPQNFEETRSSAAASLNYQFAAGGNGLVVGADGLVSWDEIGNIGFAQLEPPKRTITDLRAYVEDELQLRPALSLVLGAEVQHGSFASFEMQPTFRVRWAPTTDTTVWAAVSRAVRTPVRIDEDLVIRVPGLTLFEANDDFKTEHTTAYEIGTRHRPLSSLSFLSSFFAYRYEDLRSTEPVGPAATPLTFKNGLDARSYGGEIGVLFQPWHRLFVKGSYRYLDLKFSKDPDSRDTTGGSAEGNDPKHVAIVGAHLTLPRRIELDGYVRHASALPKPALRGYTTADVHLGWWPSRYVELSIVGRNLFDRRHAEFVTTNSLNEQVHRSGTIKLTLRR